ncbi:hypothetical protein KP806_08635 [Paenibacillus sp. N4]|uniref:hypothetical protein n=1 Tax=Paenibacillus vietnamensis TaxID=2590547 RepID=UPI001CD104D9|nr:hypothetical protein [Paenibacillus vietnamensis]MCA0755112.1 hypothetical protein [Paenibacillus vietnamensis]
MLDKAIKRYYQQKQKIKEIEQELADLRNEILAYCTEQDASELELGSHKVRIVTQERKEYDDQKLFEALPDEGVWRMLSRADPAKVAGLIKLNVITEESIKDTYSLKTVKLLQVDKK